MARGVGPNTSARSQSDPWSFRPTSRSTLRTPQRKHPFSKEKRWPCVDPQTFETNNYITDSFKIGCPIDRNHSSYSLYD